MSTFTLDEAKAQLSRLVSMVESNEKNHHYQTWPRGGEARSQRPAAPENAPALRNTAPDDAADRVRRRVHSKAAGIGPLLMCC